ncbi:stage II sporulation protein M [Moorella naiadis]|uniref:stage II sporulation protein M n=1 Tax=Moorella naiadis (nom. illeg.) TaxID=3093670 RepID=UPI003D9CA5C6
MLEALVSRLTVKMRVAYAGALFVFLFGLALGIIFPAYFTSVVVPVVEKTFDHVGAINSDFELLALIFAKNCLVAVLVLAAMPAAALLARRAERCWVLKCLAGMGWFFGKALPVLALAINGVFIAWISVILYQDGLPVAVLIGGLAPHGVFEITALILACGYAFAGPADISSRARFFVRNVTPLLALAALLEVYVTPVVMQYLLR